MITRRPLTMDVSELIRSKWLFLSLPRENPISKPGSQKTDRSVSCIFAWFNRHHFSRELCLLYSCVWSLSLRVLVVLNYNVMAMGPCRCCCLSTLRTYVIIINILNTVSEIVFELYTITFGPRMSGWWAENLPCWEIYGSLSRNTNTIVQCSSVEFYLKANS